MTWTRGKQAQLEDAAREFMRKARALGVNVEEIELVSKGKDADSVAKATEIARLERLSETVTEKDIAAVYAAKARTLREGSRARIVCVHWTSSGMQSSAGWNLQPGIQK